MEKKNLIPMPNIILQNKDLSENEKVIYGLGMKFYLFSGDKHSRTLKSFKKYILTDLGFNRKTYSKVIDSLVEKELIVDEKIAVFTRDGEQWFYNDQDTGIFSVGPAVKCIKGFTNVPLEVLSSKDLTSKDKVVYMALKRTYEYSRKNSLIMHLKTIECEKLGFGLKSTKDNIKKLSDLNLINYEVSKTGSKSNENKISMMNFKAEPSSEIDNIFVDVDYEEMLQKMISEEVDKDFEECMEKDGCFSLVNALMEASSGEVDERFSWDKWDEQMAAL